ncbi:unnamed protein product [Cyclocybe aegerita]|uniref:Uncharacterized protein n=1 Tax=Cyclocybe aegerita TaxID=1973307 RepID=A0A8S0WAR3_CYCAE|nr:unnamed protein product [Cyclocybe aegerita]
MKWTRDQVVHEGLARRQRPSDLPISGRPCFWPGCPGVSSFGPPPSGTQTSTQSASTSESPTSTSPTIPTTAVEGSQVQAIVTGVSSSTEGPVPSDLSSQSTAQSSSSNPVTIVVAVLCSLLGLLLILGLCLFLRRRRRMRQPAEHEKIEAFNVDAQGRPNPIINTTGLQNGPGTQPYPFLLPTSAATTTTLASSKMSEKKAKYGLRASNSTAATAVSPSTSSSSYPSTISYEVQQGIQVQLNALQMHLHHVEAQVARNANGNQDGTGDQEPPPVYVVALNGEGVQTADRREKM